MYFCWPCRTLYTALRHRISFGHRWKLSHKLVSMSNSKSREMCAFKVYFKRLYFGTPHVYCHCSKLAYAFTKQHRSIAFYQSHRWLNRLASRRGILPCDLTYWAAVGRHPVLIVHFIRLIAQDRSKYQQQDLVVVLSSRLHTTTCPPPRLRLRPFFWFFPLLYFVFAHLLISR